MILMIRSAHGQCAGNTWSHFIAAPGVDVVHRVAVHPNGDIYLAGTTSSFTFGEKIFLTRYTQDTILVWAKTYTLTGNDGGFSVDITVGSSGFLYMTCIVNMGLGSDAALMKLDEDGNVQWTRRAIPLSAYAEGRAVIEAPYGDVFMAGSTNSIGAGNSDAYVARFSPNGDLIWLNSYGGSGFDHFTHIDRLADDTYILGSQTSSFNGPTRKGFIARIDADGNVVGAMQHGGLVYDDYNDAYQNSDGSYLRIGYTDSYGPGGRDVLAVLADSVGNVYWSRAYGTASGNESGMNAVSDGTGGWFIAAYAGTQRDYHVLHILSDGSLAGVHHINGLFIHQTSVWTHTLYPALGEGYLLAGATMNSQGSSGWDIGIVKLDLCGENSCEMVEVSWTETDFAIPEQVIPLTISGSSMDVNAINTVVDDVTVTVVDQDHTIDCDSCPTQLLYPDTVVCSGSMVMFDIVGDTSLFQDWAWEWDMGDGQQSNAPGGLEHTYSDPGIYEVHVIAALDSGQCSDSTSFFVTVIDPPAIDLGPDIIECSSNVPVIFATSLVGIDHLWQDGSSGETMEASASGIYWVEVGAGDCYSSDTIVVELQDPTTFELGNDTVICDGSTMELGPLPWPVLWSEGTLGDQISIAAPGQYWAIYDDQVCINTDTIQIFEVTAPEVVLGPDTILCNAISFEIVPLIAEGGLYEWSTGSEAASITVDSSGFYSLGTFNECGSSIDTIEVVLVQPFLVDFGPDTVICGSSSYTLDPGFASENTTWSNGQQSSDLIVTAPGIYWVVVDIDGCIGSDSINVGWVDLPQLDLPSDTILCEAASVTLNAIAGTGDQIIWQDGSVGPTLIATAPGTYTASTQNGCGAISDSVQVLALPEFPYPMDLSICIGSTALISLEGAVSEVLWSNGWTEHSVHLPEGDYSFNAVDQYGCSHTGTFSVEVDHQNDGISYVPNTFTPNGDGCNDTFLVIGADRENFDLTIFNRWGQLIFQSNDPLIGWDGQYSGERSPDGTYLYILNSKSECDDTRTDVRRGHITLLR